MIVGICGSIGAGKDTVADMLCSQYGYQKLSWAAKLKEVAFSVYAPLGAKRRHFFGTQADKDEPILGIVGPDGRPRIGRRILELLGTQGFREICPDTWVLYALKTQVDPLLNANWVVSDVRFPNEVAVIRKRGGEIWEVQKVGGPQAEPSDHESDMAWRAARKDRILAAWHGDLDGLRELVAEAVRDASAPQVLVPDQDPDSAEEDQK